jgi:C-terminal processing protease CtpA/Prc
MKHSFAPKIALLSLLSALYLLTSCEKHVTEKDVTNHTVNAWILENMQAWYLWTDKMPTKTNQSLSPDAYFESLLYKDEDRFSWIQENFMELQESLAGIQLEAGYDYVLGKLEAGATDLFGVINYVKPNSPAEQAGLKRGDFFIAVNGTRLTESNYQQVLAATDKAHTLDKVDIRYLGGANVAPERVSLSVVKYEENPILLDTVYNLWSKKVGYLVYNFFAQDKGDGSYSYVKQLNNVFHRFQSEGIKELVLDLRYNSGGAIATAVALSSMIANRKATDLLATEQYNDYVDAYLRAHNGEAYNKLYLQDNIVRYDSYGKALESIPVNKLTQLTRVILLTSNRTASASELIINCLKPYMTVVLVGGTTYGKNVGSITVYEEDPVKQQTNTWGMQPIVVKILNSRGQSDYGNGFSADHQVSEYGSLPLQALGKTNEALLQVALGLIDPNKSQGEGVEKAKAADTPAFIPVSSSIDRTPARRNASVNLPSRRRGMPRLYRARRRYRNSWPAGEVATISPSAKTNAPFTNVLTTFVENVCPSKGDQPHLYKRLSLLTVHL